MSNAHKESAILGIDIGGTGIKAAVLDPSSGNIVSDRRKIPTPQPATAAAMITLFQQLIEGFEWQGPIGCGFPGVVKNGMVVTAPNLDSSWIGIDLAAELSTFTNDTTRVINDADAAGIAEMVFGAGTNRNQHGGGIVFLFTLGTGIGSALFVDGHLVPNTELGHIEMDGIDAEKSAATVIRERESLSWETWGKRVDQFLNYIESLFSPDCIIIGGGVSESPEKFFPYLNVNAEILTAKLGNDAGIIGAGLAVARGS